MVPVFLLVVLACAPHPAEVVVAPAPEVGSAPASPDMVAAALADLDLRVAKLGATWTEPDAPEDVGWVARRLAHLVALDTAVRRAFPPAGLSPADSARWKQGREVRITAVDAVSTTELRAAVGRFGWIDPARFGEPAAAHAYLLLQRADLPFQEEVLALMKPLLATGAVTPRNYATLFDRVALRAGRWQRFGTQGRCRGEEWVPARLDHVAAVDRFRAEIGLGTLAEYAASFRCGRPRR